MRQKLSRKKKKKGKYSVCYTKYFESTKSLYRFSSIRQKRRHIVARPSYQIIPDRNQRFCSRGKRILHSWRNLGRNLSVYVAIRLQSLQGAGEHLLRNIGDELAEGVEPEQLLPASALFATMAQSRCWCSACSIVAKPLLPMIRLLLMALSWTKRLSGNEALRQITWSVSSWKSIG